MKTKVCLIKGDGIGPEICQSVVEIFAAANANIEWIPIDAGLGLIEKSGYGIANESLDLMATHKTTLKGPTQTPVGGGHKSINVSIRKALDLYVNVRPVISVPGLDTPFKNINFVVVRENIEDTYAGIEHMQSPDVAQCLRIVTKSGSLRCHRYAFEMAKREKRKKVTCVHKANIMKLTDGLWLESFRQIAKEYPEIEASDIIVDNCCMQLVIRPQQFDVLVLPNLFGDIVSDLGAGLIGGLGVASGANIGKSAAVFEAVHGTAPDIAGQNKANPTALLYSSLTMLRHMSKLDVADRIERALQHALSSPTTRTRDLKGEVGTREFTQAVIAGLK